MKRLLLCLWVLLPGLAAAAPSPAELLVSLEREEDARVLEGLLEPAIRQPDPAAIPRLFSLLKHLDPRVRWHARAAIRAQGRAALEPAIAYLEGPALAISKANFMQAVFEDPAFHQSRAVPALVLLLKDPLLAEPAAHILGSAALPEAVAALEELALNAGPAPARDFAMAGLRRAGPAAAPALLRLSRSSDPHLALAALKSAQQAWLPGFADLAERLAQGRSGTQLGDYASRHLGSFYFADLFDFLTSLAPPAWRPALSKETRWIRDWENPAENSLVLGLHLGLMGFSFFAGAMLLLGFLRPFEPYRFTLYALLLLLLGLAGDVWLFIDSPWMLKLSAASRLTLLCGLFRSRRDLDPSRPDSLWASLAGWLAFFILPAFFYFNGELWGEALRRTGALKAFLAPALLLLAWVSLLLLDLRLKGGPRLLKSLRGQALASEGGLAAFALLLAACPFRAMQEAAAVRDYDAALVHFLSLAPLAFLALGQAFQFGQGGEKKVLWRESPSKSLKAYGSPDLLTVRLRRSGSKAWLWAAFHGLVMALAPLAPLAHAAARGSDWPGRGEGLFWMLAFSFFGYLITWNSLSILFGRELVQIRRGRARRAHTLFGAALKGGLWKKQVPVGPLDSGLNPTERQWLRDCLRRAKGHAPLAKPGRQLERPLTAEVLSASVPLNGGFSAGLSLRLGNLGGEGLSLQDLEQDLGSEIFAASAAGRPVQVYFSGADREKVIPRGSSLEIKARLAASFPLLPGMRFRLLSTALAVPAGEAELLEGGA